MAQDIQRALPRLKGDAPPEEVLKFLPKGVGGVGGGEAKGRRVHESAIPLAGRSLEKAAGREKLRFVVTIGIIVAHEELVEFHFERG